MNETFFFLLIDTQIRRIMLLTYFRLCRNTQHTIVCWRKIYPFHLIWRTMNWRKKQQNKNKFQKCIMSFTELNISENREKREKQTRKTLTNTFNLSDKQTKNKNRRYPENDRRAQRCHSRCLFHSKLKMIGEQAQSFH